MSQRSAHLRPKEAVDALLSAIGADQDPPLFDFNSVLPYPEEFKALDRAAEEAQKQDPPVYQKDGFNQGGYAWCCDNWGTKWNAYDVARRDYEGVVVTFQTAWCAPTPVIVALAKAHPLCTLHLEYFERGMAFAGGFSIPSEADWYEDEPWAPGTITGEWKTNEYGGPRGG